MHVRGGFIFSSGSRMRNPAAEIVSVVQTVRDECVLERHRDQSAVAACSLPSQENRNQSYVPLHNREGPT